MTWTIQDSKEEYLIPYWGEGYFGISDNGNLCAHPFRDDATINFKDILDELKERQIPLPTVIRFHDILSDRLKSLHRVFAKAMLKIKYEGDYTCVYPIKVNQMREVVEEITTAGKKMFIGLEAGSKSELLATLSFDIAKQSVCILNGHKDDDYIRIALVGKKIGRKMIIVIEDFSEIDRIIRISKEMDIEPIIGIRAKLISKGLGPWADSSGPKAKFGLSTSEILKAIEILKKNNFENSLKLVHFHIGSQVPTLETISNASMEAARIYCSLVKSGIDLEFLDIGGGLGVNYEGIAGNSETAIKYSVSDYVETVLKIVKSTCDEEDVEHPHIVSECGRYLTAHHSCIVTNVIGKSSTDTISKLEVTSKQKDVREFLGLLEEISEQNFNEIYFKAHNLISEILEAFKQGKIEIADLSTCEDLLKKIILKIQRLNLDSPIYKNFIEKIAPDHSLQYVCNFSVFQSVPDSWAISQILPIAPLTRLEKKPTQKVRIVDITCDSDGKISRYAGSKGTKTYINLHEFDEEKEEYPIGIFLTGAYQDIMGDMHNLFGRLNEVHLYYDSHDEKNFYIEEFVEGQRSGDVLNTLQYNSGNLAQSFKAKVDEQIKRGKIRPRVGVELVDFYERSLEQYTYLS